MEVLHSLQGHPLSGKQWMKMIDEMSIDDLGFPLPPMMDESAKGPTQKEQH